MTVLNVPSVIWSTTQKLENAAASRSVRVAAVVVAVYAVLSIAGAVIAVLGGAVARENPLLATKISLVVLVVIWAAKARMYRLRSVLGLVRLSCAGCATLIIVLGLIFGFTVAAFAGSSALQ